MSPRAPIAVVHGTTKVFVNDLEAFPLVMQELEKLSIAQVPSHLAHLATASDSIMNAVAMASSKPIKSLRDTFPFFRCRASAADFRKLRALNDAYAFLRHTSVAEVSAFASRIADCAAMGSETTPSLTADRFSDSAHDSATPLSDSVHNNSFDTFDDASGTCAASTSSQTPSCVPDACMSFFYGDETINVGMQTDIRVALPLAEACVQTDVHLQNSCLTDDPFLAASVALCSAAQLTKQRCAKTLMDVQMLTDKYPCEDFTILPTYLATDLFLSELVVHTFDEDAIALCRSCLSSLRDACLSAQFQDKQHGCDRAEVPKEVEDQVVGLLARLGRVDLIFSDDDADDALMLLNHRDIQKWAKHLELGAAGLALDFLLANLRTYIQKDPAIEDAASRRSSCALVGKLAKARRLELVDVANAPTVVALSGAVRFKPRRPQFKAVSKR